jgi:hypothetical protein
MGFVQNGPFRVICKNGHFPKNAEFGRYGCFFKTDFPRLCVATGFQNCLICKT